MNFVEFLHGQKFYGLDNLLNQILKITIQK